MELSERIWFLRSGGHVVRFHAEPYWNGPRQKVSEHSFNMALIANVLMEYHPNLHNYAKLRILQAVLFHDLSEQAVGDVPAPTKWAIEGLLEKLDKYEEIVIQNLGGSTDLTASETSILVAADFLEVCYEATEQYLTGNRFVTRVFDQLRSAYRTKKKIRDSIQYNEKAKELYEGLATIWAEIDREQSGVLCQITSMDPRQLLKPVDSTRVSETSSK